MLSPIFSLLFIFSLISCSLFKSQNIQNESVQTLVGYVQGEGEGKGRLGIGQNQYLFGFDSLLKENHDWLLAANIPLHGEEILLLPNLKFDSAPKESQSLERRIEIGISDYLKSKKKNPELARHFMVELRRLMRVVFAKKLNLDLKCTEVQCQMGEVIYQVKASSKQISLKKSLNDDYEIEFVAMNLTDSIFKRSNIFLHSKNKTSTSPTLLSLELFWN